MVYEVVLQWAAIFLTILVLVWNSKGQGTLERKAVTAFLAMTLLLNVGYLFELMADSVGVAFMARQLAQGGLIFMGYFICLFFCYYTSGYVPVWLAVYTFIFDFIMLVMTWTSRWHELIYRNIRYEQVGSLWELHIERGELWLFLSLGCEVLPMVATFVTICSYICREHVDYLRRQIVVLAALAYLSYGMALVYAAFVFPGHYNFAGVLCMLFADIFVIGFRGKSGFNLDIVSADRMFADMGEGIIVTDASMNLLRFNQAAKRVFPELEPSLIHHNIRLVHSIPLELFDEYEKKKIDLENQHYEVSRTVIRDCWKQIRGYVLILDDQTVEFNYITEIVNGRKKAEKAERDALHALEEAEEANRAKSDFLANVSHEIRTPMNAIVGLAELIIEETLGRKEYDFACDIKNASMNLLGLINDILSLSKIEAGQMELEQVEYSVEQLLEEALHLAKLSAFGKGLQLKREISPKLPCRMVGDEMRIRQMVGNFLDFAMKYTEEGYVKLTVTHKWLDEKRVLMVFQFEDTGEGFAPEDAKRLFDRFQPMDERKGRNLESIGLGIAITKRFLDLMDGTVDVNSEVGRGTIFTVCFPQQVADMRSIEQRPWRELNVQKAEDEAFIVPDYRVLVVDDNKINLKVACGALSPYQFQVESAGSGKKAIHMVMETAYDMILMDHMMPEMDGIEAAGRIRSDCGENGKKPVIIALSANAYDNAREMFISNGFQDFIAKPIDKNELRELLCRWIGPERRQPAEGASRIACEAPGAEEALSIPGIDVTEALSRHTGGVGDYLELLELYCMDGREKRVLLERLAREEDYKNYQIEVHGLKSASANIGACELSELAKRHEFAAKDGDYAFIRDGAPELLQMYVSLLHEIERVLKSRGRFKEEEPKALGGRLSPEETQVRMEEILSDIENFESKAAAGKVQALLAENIEKSALDCLKDVKNRLKMYDDDAAEDLLRTYLSTHAAKAE